jgi:hypothetical protein
MTGDIASAKEIGDRLDGKATEHHEHSGKDGAPLVITWQPPSA